MFLSIGQVRAIVDKFMELTDGRPVRLTITIVYEDANGKEDSVAAGYSLEGLYPERETSSDIIPPQARVCVLCDERTVEEGHVFCSECELHEHYEDFGDDDDA